MNRCDSSTHVEFIRRNVLAHGKHNDLFDIYVINLSKIIHNIVTQGARQPLSPGQYTTQPCITDQVSKGHHVEVGCHRLSSGDGDSGWVNMVV